jgi:hypothetical protein
MARNIHQSLVRGELVVFAGEALAGRARQNFNLIQELRPTQFDFGI